MQIQFSWLIAILKATKKTITPILVFGLALIVKHPEWITKILGHWSEMTIAGAVLWLIQLFTNWLQNKDLGKA